MRIFSLFELCSPSHRIIRRKSKEGLEKRVRVRVCVWTRRSVLLKERENKETNQKKPV